jgi:hypothetical protein
MGIGLEYKANSPENISEQMKSFLDRKENPKKIHVTGGTVILNFHDFQAVEDIVKTLSEKKEIEGLNKDELIILNGLSIGLNEFKNRKSKFNK